ncbi:MAG: hypothetical protein IK114_14345 [Fibrobacter sp.]|nr:hypothetical protein [Fibrobacter sp.]
MLNHHKLNASFDEFAGASKKRFNDALTALLALAWKYRHLGADFSYEADETLYKEALKICVELSDNCVADARRITYDLITDSLDYADEEVAFETALGDQRDRFDMTGAHLLELLGVWVGLALARDYTQGYLRVLISRYLNNPFLCPLWREAGIPSFGWGRGYAFNIFNQLSLIGADLITDAARYAEWVDAMENGALYYVLRRGSSYDCPECDSMCGKPIPIDTPFERPHPRCQCYPEYIFEPMEI